MEPFNFEKELVSLDRVLLFYAIKLTASKDKAKDLVQDTFLKALSNKEKFNKEKFTTNASLRNWTYTIMHNTFIDQYRVAKKVFIIDNKYLITEFQFLGNLPDVYSNLCVIDIYKKIDMVPRISQQSFKLFLEGFKYAEIADDLNISMAAVKSNICRARKCLKPLLAEYRFFND